MSVKQSTVPHKPDSAPPKAHMHFWNNPVYRGWFVQAVLVLITLYLGYSAFLNTVFNMKAHGIPTDLGFLPTASGFDITQSPIEYSAVNSYGRAFLVGLLNTLIVGAVGVVLTTGLGFTVGIARLSKNWIISKFAAIYIETLRNTPLLLQLLFIYNAVLKSLPGPKQSIILPGGAFLNNRGLILPTPIFNNGASFIGFALGLGVLTSLAYAKWASMRKIRTGQDSPVGRVAACMIILVPVIVYFAAGMPVSLEFPVLKGFNFSGGYQLYPEFVALTGGLVLYTAAFIAEIVRAGILAVSKGQSEAAGALGLNRRQTLKLIVIPQAMRVIIPPLTSQYLNLVKNSTLAIFIGYPELAQVFMGTVLNQTGAAVQCVTITMLVYLMISLTTSVFMNFYNSRKTLVER